MPHGIDQLKASVADEMTMNTFSTYTTSMPTGFIDRQRFNSKDLWLVADPGGGSPPQGDSPQSDQVGFLLKHTPVQPLDTWRAEPFVVDVC